jgi:hypothetical protein
MKKIDPAGKGKTSRSALEKPATRKIAPKSELEKPASRMIGKTPPNAKKVAGKKTPPAGATKNARMEALKSFMYGMRKKK